jgi:hypothetical protein
MVSVFYKNFLFWFKSALSLTVNKGLKLFLGGWGGGGGEGGKNI